MIKIALCQIRISKNKINNLKKAKLFIEKSKKNKAKIIVLPEMFTCPYEFYYIKKYAEKKNEETFCFLKEMSKNCILIGGSIVEKNNKGFLYNTSYVFENKKLISKYRKINLFNIKINNNFKNQESYYFKKGKRFEIAKTSIGKIAILICFDIRFPELFFKIKKKENPFLYIIPCNFNEITGKSHLELLGRTRAIDSQSFVAINSSALNIFSKFKNYSHSMIINPWGEIIKEIKNKEDIIFAKINLKEINLIRKKIVLNY